MCIAFYILLVVLKDPENDAAYLPRLLTDLPLRQSGEVKEPAYGGVRLMHREGKLSSPIYEVCEIIVIERLPADYTRVFCSTHFRGV